MPGFDTVTHLDDPRYSDVVAVARQARAAGIEGWVVAAGDPARWDAVERAAKVTGGLCALGAHPWWTATADVDTRRRWLAELDRRMPAAVGEIGLDHFRVRDAAGRAAQAVVFREQLAWARGRDVPVLIHAVRAVPDMLAIVRRDGLPARGGVVHGWTGTPALAHDVVAAGLHISIGPTVQAPSGHKIRATLASVPRDRVMLETDCPAVQPSGALTTPGALVHVAAEVARVWSEIPDVVLGETAETARRLLGV